MHKLTLLLVLLASFNAAADLADEDANSAFVAGVRAFDDGQFDLAVVFFETVVAAQPDCARCAHFLGKSYGKLAEQAGWTQAIELAKKTRIALEQAVALAPNDAEAIKDLIKYYRAAPGFLGGDNKKADALEQRLRRFQSASTSLAYE